ncbi:MAG: LysR family transcriptional regulator [Pseudomonadota bacterium]
MNWRSLPSLASLRAFAALADAGGASAAGAALNVSHAAVSQQVRALERDLGLKLIRKDGRGLALTGEGERLARVALGAFGAMAAEADALRASEEARGLRVTTTPAFAANWLMPRIADFRAKHPEIDFTLDPTPALADLGPGGADLAIRFGNGDWPGVDAEPLVPSDFVIVGAPGIIGDRPIEEPADLLDMPWLQELGTNEVDDWLTSRGVTARRTGRITSLPGTLIVGAVVRGDGVTATARAFVEAELKSGALRCLFAEEGANAGYHLVTPRGVLSPAARAFVAWARRQRAN